MKAIKFRRKTVMLCTAMVLFVFGVYLFFANSLFMKTTFISDWTKEGYAVYYFDCGLIIQHPIRRAYQGGLIDETQSFEKAINRYHILLPVECKTIPIERVRRMKQFAFEELDVMNKQMPGTIRSDCTATTTFYRRFKRVTYYGEPYGYLGTLAGMD